MTSVQLWYYYDRWVTWACPSAARNALRVKTQALIAMDNGL